MSSFFNNSRARRTECPSSRIGAQNTHIINQIKVCSDFSECGQFLSLELGFSQEMLRKGLRLAVRQNDLDRNVEVKTTTATTSKHLLYVATQ